jgi:hypothetical protein
MILAASRNVLLEVIVIGFIVIASPTVNPVFILYISIFKKRTLLINVLNNVKGVTFLYDGTRLLPMKLKSQVSVQLSGLNEDQLEAVRGVIADYATVSSNARQYICCIVKTSLELAEKNGIEQDDMVKFTLDWLNKSYNDHVRHAKSNHQHLADKILTIVQDQILAASSPKYKSVFNHKK